MLIVLDRDGVINADTDDYVKCLAEWHPLPGAIEAIARLSRAGHTVAVATNQAGLARGLFDLDDLEAIHAELERRVTDAGGALAGIFYCPHHPEDGCECRKPRPGLLDAIARELLVDLGDSVVIGDSLRDLEAGTARGCRPLLVRTGKGSRSLRELSERGGAPWPHFAVVDDLAAAADLLLGEAEA